MVVDVGIRDGNRVLARTASKILNISEWVRDLARRETSVKTECWVQVGMKAELQLITPAHVLNARSIPACRPGKAIHVKPELSIEGDWTALDWRLDTGF